MDFDFKDFLNNITGEVIYMAAALSEKCSANIALHQTATAVVLNGAGTQEASPLCSGRLSREEWVAEDRE